MNVKVIEQVTKIVKPKVNGKTVVVSQSGYGNNIPKLIGQAKGDIIVFRGRGDPVRLQSGNIDGRILVTDSSSPTGWSIIPNSSSSGSSVTLHNSLNQIVPGGTVVKISHDYDFVLATSADTTMLFITAEDCDPDTDVVCYGVANTICAVRCGSGAVAIGDMLGVSSLDGIAETVAENGFAIALTDKEAGSEGLVNAIISQNGFLPLEGGTLTGNLEVDGDLKVYNASNASIVLQNDGGNNSKIQARRPVGQDWGSVLLVYAGGNAVIGAGDFAGQAYENDIESCQGSGENLLLGADQKAFIISNAQTIAERKTWIFDTDGSTKLPAALGLAYGGTGATTAANARTNLGVTGIALRPDYQFSTTDLTAGTSSLTTGKLYFVYE